MRMLYHALSVKQWDSVMHHMDVDVGMCEMSVVSCIHRSYNLRQTAATVEGSPFRLPYHETVAAARQWVMKVVFTYLIACERVGKTVLLTFGRMVEIILGSFTGEDRQNASSTTTATFNYHTRRRTKNFTNFNYFHYHGHL
eukprot:GHVS01018397.1.p1 GENE.GHVS01018397.1~~GHVS01018397.1.p1  ORF type:complete len:141 (-),score=11.55 GHVS01018397.1:67-489(-)